MSRTARSKTSFSMGDPDFKSRPKLELKQLANPPGMPMLPGVPTQIYTLGECRIIVTRNPPNARWHMSISHPSRYPNWDEIAEARYRICPDNLTMAILLPPSDEYVNVHPNCFQLHEISNPD